MWLSWTLYKYLFMVPWKVISVPNCQQVLGKAVPSHFCPFLHTIFRALPSESGEAQSAWQGEESRRTYDPHQRDFKSA